MDSFIIINHKSGAKANKVEKIEIKKTEFLIGRDQTADIAFDSQKDDLVSRRHAQIKVVGKDPLTFKINDLGSSNGTFLNGRRLGGGDNDLVAGDSVELGPGGAKFLFDFEPRPQDASRQTRISDAAASRETKISGGVPPSDPPPSAAASSAYPPTMKVGVGRNTVMSLLSAERQAVNRKWLYMAGGGFALVALVVGVLLFRMDSEKSRTLAQLDQIKESSSNEIERMKNENSRKDQEIIKHIGLMPKDIIDRYGSSTVFIKSHWRIKDRVTGRSIFHKVDLLGSMRIPCYVLLEDGRVVPWLTLDDKNRINLEVGVSSEASGFVVDSQGYILTNKHVAAGWTISYDKYNNYSNFRDVSKDSVRLYKFSNSKNKKLEFDTVTFDGNSTKFNRIPEHDKNKAFIFDANAPFLTGSRAVRNDNEFQGENERLEVRFPGDRISYNATLSRFSPYADVALIKIDAQNLPIVQLAANNSVTLGDSITVLGYPGSSIKDIASDTTIEGGEFRKINEEIPAPTVTPGVISRIGQPYERHGTMETFGEMGDVYQLTAGTSAGNSGGPVFDSAGKVIGIFTYGTRRETTTFAVPIRYARELLPDQKQH